MKKLLNSFKEVLVSILTMTVPVSYTHLANDLDNRTVDDG